MDLKKVLELYHNHPGVIDIQEGLKDNNAKILLKGAKGSSIALIAGALFNKASSINVFIVQDKEEAAFFYNDLQNLFNERELPSEKRKILFYPTSYKRPYEIEKTDNVNVLSRTEVLKKINSSSRKLYIVTYPEALSEKVISKRYLKQNTLKIESGDELGVDFVTDLLSEYNFDRVDFVTEPGQFSIRGGIVDVFSFGNENPYRIEFFGDEVESIRTFDIASQLTINKLKGLSIIPNIQDRTLKENRSSFLNYLPGSTIFWTMNLQFINDVLIREFEKAQKAYSAISGEVKHLPPSELFTDGEEFYKKILTHKLIEFNKAVLENYSLTVEFNTRPQPTFHKNFELLSENLNTNSANGIQNLLFSGNTKQLDRLRAIFEDMKFQGHGTISYQPVNISIHEGFIDNDINVAIYTNHQIFERHHRFHLRDSFKNKQAVTIKELYNLQPGDYVTHIDHGIGQFDGLEKINNNGKLQEAIRLIYSNGDLLYVSIHSLHRISKYTGKEGTEPKLHRLGSNVWSKVKTKTKSKVKDIAKDLIALYAKRKASQGFTYSADSYLQHELESSFIYEDTPDQLSATISTKEDMEKPFPMDRLVCGDVGFGKTEIAIRAAFKAVADNKQVAILVPTTILALQHYKTFRNRLKDFPCTVDYVNRFKTAKQTKETLKKLKEGKIDILIGTHRIVSKDIVFKDIGLLIIDEEQKFGVSIKEKLKQFRTNVDTLTLTATPIPRTLQFSLMGARDLSIINTPPPNRNSVQTEIISFSEEAIRDAIHYELSRNGQVYFVHNRVQNITDVAGIISRFVPDARIAIGHGQMSGAELEKIMLDFIEGEYDILVATTIIESGLDIPNANTILINDAQNYGLSDLHQLRGRVGRSNKQAFCYLLSPPLTSLTAEARKRLQALEQFSDLGSGINIAMRDLDIRGAGDILGAEQSGFISDIGYEMYQKILTEAVNELKENEFKELYKDEKSEIIVSDCQIETDLEILIPDEYITNIAERLALYKELDSIETEEKLQNFEINLIDRFGPIPQSIVELLNTIRLRWIAKELGFEKLVLKSDRMACFFIANQDSDYFQSSVFSSILSYIQQNPQKCRIKENKNRLSMLFTNIDSIKSALSTITPIKEISDKNKKSS